MTLQISLVHQFKQQQEETWDLRFSLDGKSLVSSDGKALYLWQRDENGNWEYERSLAFSDAAFPCFAPDGKTLAFRDREKFVRLISLDGRVLATLPYPSQTNCAFSADQHWLVSGDTSRNILLWDLRTYQCFTIPVPFPAFRDNLWSSETSISNETVRCFRFTQDGQWLMFGASSQKGYVHICHIDPVQKCMTRQKTLPLLGILNLAIAPNGKMLAIVHQEEVYIYDLESLQQLQKFSRMPEVRYCLVAFSPDSQFLMSSKPDGWVDIFSLASFDCIDSFAAHSGLSSDATDPIGGLDWSKTGYIATGGASVFDDVFLDRPDYTIKIWKVDY